MESILEGTWGSGPWPEEVAVADVLLETKWTWQEWCQTPPYIRSVIVDFIQARRTAERNEADQQQRQHEVAMRRGH